MAGERRRLVAVLAADVVGYTRLVGADEDGTLARLRALFREVVQPTVAAHRGRVFKLVGDAVLAEFPSAVDAVRCAAAVQDAVEARGAAEPEARRIRLRAAVHLGDVVAEGGDLLGDGVNVAARLGGLAEPGGVVLSAKVADEVRGRVPAALEDLGEQALKHVGRPVRAFRLGPARGAPAPAPAPPGPALPDRPSIAVLPFANIGGDPGQEHFADGLVEDITTALSRIRWLFVIARTSAFTYKGRAVDVRQVARELGVRYVLEGSVRAAAGRIRVTGQLVDAGTGRHIWAERYDRDLHDIFAVQDEITRNAVAAIEPHLYAEEGLRAAARPPGGIDAWGLVVRALGLISRVGRRQSEEALALLGRAVALEPGYARAHAVLGWAVWWAARNHWLPDRWEGGRQAARHAEEAVALDAAEPWGRMMLGICLSDARRHERALVEHRAALDLNPSFALGRSFFGWALLRAGRFEEAVAETGLALRMSPVDGFSGLYTAAHGLALLGARRFEEALPPLRAAVAAFAEYAGHQNTLISCCGHLGLREEAAGFIEARDRLDGPPLRAGTLRENLKGFAHCDVFVEGLVKAGVPE